MCVFYYQTIQETNCETTFRSTCSVGSNVTVEHPPAWRIVHSPLKSRANTPEQLTKIQLYFSLSITQHNHYVSASTKRKFSKWQKSRLKKQSQISSFEYAEITGSTIGHPQCSTEWITRTKIVIFVWNCHLESSVELARRGQHLYLGVMPLSVPGQMAWRPLSIGSEDIVARTNVLMGLVLRHPPCLTPKLPPIWATSSLVNWQLHSAGCSGLRSARAPERVIYKYWYGHKQTVAWTIGSLSSWDTCHVAAPCTNFCYCEVPNYSSILCYETDLNINRMIANRST